MVKINLLIPLIFPQTKGIIDGVGGIRSDCNAYVPGSGGGGGYRHRTGGESQGTLFESVKN